MDPMRLVLALALSCGIARADPCASLYAEAEHSDDPRIARELRAAWNRCLDRGGARPILPPDEDTIEKALEPFMILGTRCDRIRSARMQARTDGRLDLAERWEELELAECWRPREQSTKEWRLKAARACVQRDRAGALEAMRFLGPMDRQFVIYMCRRNDVSIE
jgi:hypothetical protein